MYRKTKILKSSPSVLSQYARTVRKKPNKKTTLPGLILRREGIQIDANKVKKYADVCGFQFDGKHVPPVYPHILAFALQMELLLDKDAPFPIIGMVHLYNTITVHKPITVDQELTIEVFFDEMKDHDKGKIVPIITRMYVFGELVWEERSENLKRLGKGSGKKSKKTSDVLSGEQQQWDLDYFAGIRYAFTGGAGDFNPIHLLPITAKPLGFKRHIIHGMWTKARCVAALQTEIGDQPFTVDVSFKLPVFLPATVTFTRAEKSDGIEFEVRDKENVKPHVVGQVTFHK